MGRQSSSETPLPAREPSGGARTSTLSNVSSASSLSRDGKLDAFLNKPKRGWLYKRGGKIGNKGWDKRMFLFENGALMYFKNEKDSRAINKINIEDMVAVYQTSDSSKFRFSFELRTVDRTYFLATDDNTEFTGWLVALGSAIEHKEQFKDLGQDEQAGYLHVRPSLTRTWAVLFVVVKEGILFFYEVCRCLDDFCVFCCFRL
jgi:hypothetical protein